ncbi:hypothetical protein MMC14_007452 [Varicellaria rhodocarpa]|nr:hypothetical protein [Varicellaria rhodocarpa]
MNSSNPSNLVHLDGTTLEGGGQLLRLALSLSSLTRIPIHVTDIRGKRAPRSRSGRGGGGGGGLKTSHLAGAQWLATATAAETVGMVVKSTEIIFKPYVLEEEESDFQSSNSVGASSSIASDPKLLQAKSMDTGSNKLSSKQGLAIRESHIRMSTPGSIFLVLQAILPYLIFSSDIISAHTSPADDGDSIAIPQKLTIEGGTNVTQSLSFEYASQVLLPMLHSKLGIGPIEMTLHRRGWSMGSTSVGKVGFDVTPLRPGSTLPAFCFKDRGFLSKIYLSVLAPTVTFRSSVITMAKERLQGLYPDVSIDIEVNESSHHPKRLYLLLVAEASNGYRLGRDWLYDHRIKEETMENHTKELVEKVVNDLRRELDHGGCLDEFLQDQLVVFQALAKGRSVIQDGHNGEGSLHTKTARWVVEQVLGLKFERGSCNGIGFQVGQTYWKDDSPENVKGLEKGLE